MTQTEQDLIAKAQCLAFLIMAESALESARDGIDEELIPDADIEPLMDAVKKLQYRVREALGLLRGLTHAPQR